MVCGFHELTRKCRSCLGCTRNDDEDQARKTWIEEHGYTEMIYGNDVEGVHYQIPTPVVLAVLAATFVALLSVVLWYVGSLYAVLHGLLMKLLELSYVLALLLPFAGKLGRSMERKYGELGFTLLLRAELRKEFQKLEGIAVQSFEALPGLVRTEIKQVPQQLQHATLEAVTSVKNLQAQLGSKLDATEQRMHNALQALPSVINTEVRQLQEHFQEMPGQMKHAVEDSWHKIAGEVATFKHQIGVDVRESERRMVCLFEKLPTEVENKIKSGFANLTTSIQGELNAVKSHVSEFKQNVAESVKSTGSMCGSVSRSRAMPM